MRKRGKEVSILEIDKVIELSSKIDRLKIALKYYSNKENWNFEKHMIGSVSTEYIPILDDKGRVARLALENN